MPDGSPSPPPKPESAAERNLLFGVLALQNNFITRDALLWAFAVWVADKGRLLGDILCEQGKLTQSQNDLLLALTEEHVKQHSHDPEQSLAAVSSVRWLPDELRKLGDPRLAASLAILARQAPAVDPDATRSFSTTDWGGDGQRFRVLRPHAKGGLGEVFVAQDLELRREVALKEIQVRFADQPHSRARFVQEAEITGRLEHPGIVPVYGLGQYADGRPFYAMRFIRGDSLKEAIKRFHKAEVAGRAPGERTLEVRKLLGRFIDVCEAMEYAHSRGVLHRDLKPGNIMLGRYGETLIVDWGLAKPVGRAEHSSETDETTLHPASGDNFDPTVMGSAIGTPGYMSPEQAAGRLDDLGPASDVYSLGATLYTLLTGKPPFSGGDDGEILRRVQSGEFPPPREIRPKTPAALQAICLKAMETSPTDRYPSPKMLSADIEHWLADEPVSCLSEPFVVRAWRWIKRHRALVTGMAATLLTSFAGLLYFASMFISSSFLRSPPLAVGLGAIVFIFLVSLVTIAAIVGRRNGALSRKNQELEAANLREREATELAQANKRSAKENAAVARQQSQRALMSLESVVLDIHRRLDDVGNAGDVKRELLQSVQARLQEVSEQFAAGSAIDRNTSALGQRGDLAPRA